MVCRQDAGGPDLSKPRLEAGAPAVFLVRKQVLIDLRHALGDFQ